MKTNNNQTEGQVNRNGANSALFDARLKKYGEISTNVWAVFKKYLPENASLHPLCDDMQALDDEYKGKEGYRFMQRLLKVYFDELRDIKG